MTSLDWFIAWHGLAIGHTVGFLLRGYLERRRALRGECGICASKHLVAKEGEK